MRTKGGCDARAASARSRARGIGPAWRFAGRGPRRARGLHGGRRASGCDPRAALLEGRGAVPREPRLPPGDRLPGAPFLNRLAGTGRWPPATTRWRIRRRPTTSRSRPARPRGRARIPTRTRPPCTSLAGQLEVAGHPVEGHFEGIPSPGFEGSGFGGLDQALQPVRVLGADRRGRHPPRRHVVGFGVAAARPGAGGACPASPGSRPTFCTTATTPRCARAIVSRRGSFRES